MQLELVVLAQDQHHRQLFYMMLRLLRRPTLSLELVIHLLAGQMAQQYLKQVPDTQLLA
jgi:hypothetical protein